MSPETLRSRRADKRRVRRALQAMQAGAPTHEVARILHVRTSTAERLRKALDGRQTRSKEKKLSDKHVPPIDLSDERSLRAELDGKPVMLTPMPDGSIAVTRLGSPASGELSTMTTTKVASIAELADRLEALTGGEASPSSGADGSDLSDEEIYDEWRRYAKSQGIDLAESEEAPPLDLALKPGDVVTWGSGQGQGQGAGHGVLMEIDTAEGNALVHTAEVIKELPGGPQLSPTGKTIKMDLGKLRASTLKVLGETPVGPELSDSCADGDLSYSSPSEALGDLSDDEFYGLVAEELGRMEGGFGG